MKWSKGVFRQYIATFSCLLCSMMVAVCFVWYTPLMVWLLTPENQEIPNLDNDQLSWLIAIIEVGELLGPVPCGFIADRWGRKPCLLITSPLVILSWVIMFLTRSLIGLYAARIIQGIAIGIIITIAPIYIAEISDSKIRGQLGGHLQTLWYCGTLYAYCTGPFLSYQNYIIVSAIPAILFLAVFFFVPETPYFYMMVGRRKEAEESLTWLRGDNDIKFELQSISDSVNNNNKNDSTASGWKALFSKECRKSVAIITIIFTVRSIGGTTVVTSFATQTFSKSVSDPRDADLITMGMGIVLIITTLGASTIADSFGRKPLMILSLLGLGLSNSVIGAYYYIEREAKIDTTNFSWVVYAGYICYCITYNIALGPLSTTLQAEYFPSHVRAAAGAYTTIMGNFIRFSAIKQYQLIQDNVGLYCNFLIYASFSFVGLFFLVPFMDETAKKTLHQIHNK